ncbi:MAG: hypothetical protein FWG98_02725 [Candidatus Cloacimonetes bacterium]|nr:hypothetical protein [Candidatus Cloacimonadota bacterium]
MRSRIIYVVPFITIIEQNAKKIKNILGDNNVSEHHSNLIPDINKENHDEESKLIGQRKIGIPL